MFKRFNLLAVVTVIGLALLTGVVATACSPATAQGPVRVTLNEFSIKLGATSAPAGKITFDAANQGNIEHELIVLKTDLAPNALKMLAADPTKVDEEAGAKNLGEVENIAAGTTKSGTFDLPAGKYVLICNTPEHYKSGMTVAFEVK